MRRGRLLLPLTTLVLALAVWLSRGALAVTDGVSWPRRLGILPSRWAPGILVLVLFAALWRRHRAILIVLLIPGVLLLPWLPVRVPAAALLWTGHAVLWVWIATALAIAVVTCRRCLDARVFSPLREPRTGSVAAFATAFALYCAAAWLVSPVVPGGDEPHYLVITQSLLKDGDLQIENNHAQGDYKAYFPGDLRPDFLHRGKDEQIYSIHAPGLPALVLPAFAVAGYHGVIAFLALLSAFATWLVWRAAYRVTGSAGAAWFGWASVAVSVPFFFHAFTVYPDAAGAAIVVAAVYALINCESDGRGADGPAIAQWGSLRWLLLGGVIAVLPWLHTRFVGLEAVLVSCLALRLAGRRAFLPLAAFVLLPAVSTAAWFGYFYVIYGEFSPAAPYGHYTQSALANVPRGLPGLLFDQQFGVLPNAPAYAFGLLGLFSLFRARRRLAVEMTLVLLSYVLLVSAYYMWWGGWSAPARFVVPVLLMLGVPAASFWSRQRAAGKAVALGALAMTVLITASLALVDRGSLIFNSRDGFALWLEWLTPVVDLPHALPSFLRDSTGTALTYVAIWIACFALAAGAVRALARRTEGDSETGTAKLALGTLLTFAAATMIAASVAWSIAGLGGATPTTSAMSVLRAYDPAARPVGVRLTPFARLSIDELPGRLPLPVSNRRPADNEGPLLMLFDVPPGVYRLSRASALAAQGNLTVAIGRSREPLVRWAFDPSDRGREYQFTLPVRVNSIVVSGDGAARRSMPRIALEPASIAPEVWRFTSPPAAQAVGYENMTAFAFQPDVYLEGAGIWVTGGLPTSMVFAGPAGASTVRLLVRNAPVENTITLRGQSRVDVLPMKPGEVRVIELPLDPRNRGALIEITAERGYRPADVDKTTQDRRYLGVWIQGAAK
jgi:hypothetical protein